MHRRELLKLSDFIFFYAPKKQVKYFILFYFICVLCFFLCCILGACIQVDRFEMSDQMIWAFDNPTLIYVHSTLKPRQKMSSLFFGSNN